MILSNTRNNNNNNYPFISSCDLDLGTGNKLENGVFISAKLYPNAAPFNYAYIAYIGKGSLIINTDADVELCRVNFDVDSTNTILVGTAYQESKICGYICATHNLKPVLNARYAPRKDSFIFTPSVVNPRPAINDAHGLRSAAGEKITAVEFSGGTTFVTENGSTGLNIGDVAASENLVISSIQLEVSGGATVSLKGDNVNIRSGKDCGVRVVPADSGLIIGAYKDV